MGDFDILLMGGVSVAGMSAFAIKPMLPGIQRLKKPVHDALGSVSTNARMASTKSSSVRVGFKYGFSIRPVATSKKPIRLVIPCRIYSNSMQAALPGITGLSGYLCSNA